jgi:hypothetical protein
MTRAERIALHKKQERLQLSDGIPSLSDLTEGIPVIRSTFEGIVEYLKYNNVLYKQVFDKELNIGLGVGDRIKVDSLTAAYSIPISASGTIYSIDQDAAFTVELPAVDAFAGMWFRFVLADAGSNDVKINSNASNGIKGFSMDPTTGINAIDNNLVKFVSGTAVVGDYIELWNDGAVWWCESFSSATNGILGANS